jgi:uncharacterized protein (DUF39 family)
VEVSRWYVINNRYFITRSFRRRNDTIGKFLKHPIPFSLKDVFWGFSTLKEREYPMSKTRTIEEINEKIAKGKVVVLTAEEILDEVEKNGLKGTLETVDVVTTATFGPMCSSGAFLNFGHSDPPIRMTKTTLNDVEAYSGIAAVDTYIGATQLSETEGDRYGGAHVICDLIGRKPVQLKASSPGTDCYPRNELNIGITLDMINEAYLFNPRNSYQNYGAAINLSDETKYTYMGTLRSFGANVTFSTCGQLSPLLNDPEYRTIGIGTRLFLAGAQGYVAWQGTQFFSARPRNAFGIPVGGAGSLALIGDMKTMDPRWVRPLRLKNYGISLYVGIGVPIPILDIEMVRRVAVRNREIQTFLYDYGVPRRERPIIATIDYEQLWSGSIIVNGKKVPAAPMSNIRKAREIAQLLKTEIADGRFLLTAPVARFPSDHNVNSLVNGC